MIVQDSLKNLVLSAFPHGKQRDCLLKLAEAVECLQCEQCRVVSEPGPLLPVVVERVEVTEKVHHDLEDAAQQLGGVGDAPDTELEDDDEDE